VPANFRRQQNAGVSFIREIARVARHPIGCREAVELLEVADALAGYAPRIIPTDCSTAETTLISIPSLMVGQRRLVRFRLMRGYIRSIQKDVSMRLEYQVERLVRNGRWNSVFALVGLRSGARIIVALLYACGILFLVRIRAPFKQTCSLFCWLLDIADRIEPDSGLPPRHSSEPFESFKR
jgi:hypothetical protein